MNSNFNLKDLFLPNLFLKISHINGKIIIFLFFIKNFTIDKIINEVLKLSPIYLSTVPTNINFLSPKYFTISIPLLNSSINNISFELSYDKNDVLFGVRFLYSSIYFLFIFLDLL